VYYFSKNSENNLLECHLDLYHLFHRVIKYQDCFVIIGYRGEQEQDRAFHMGSSQLKYPQSKHNKKPSLAVDVVPWFKSFPHIRWDDKEKLYYFGGFVLGVAAEMGINIRWGGDWDQDGELHDQKFFDLSHFELGGIDGN